MELTSVRDRKQECLRALGVLNDDNVAHGLIFLIQFNAAMDAAVQFDGTFRAERVCRGIKADDDFAAFETMAFGECVKYDTVEALGTMSIRQP
jgi:hypothetical protein